MSHPFTIEYMQAGKTNVSGQIGGEITKLRADQEGEQAHESPTMYKESKLTRICDSESITEDCQTDQIEENPDIGMEVIREEMKIAITDEEIFSFTKILEISIRRRMEIFADEASIVGLSHLVKPSSYKVGSNIRKVVWTLLLLFGTGFMVFQMYDRISYYLSYPTVVKYRVAYNQSLRFPTVTICSESLASK